MLTKAQIAVYEFVKDFFCEHNFAPTIKEIAEALGLKAHAPIFERLHALEEEGLIRLEAGKRRNIILTTDPSRCLPIVGRIAAGEPIEVIDTQQWLNLTETLVGNNRYLLLVKGDSMIEENIRDGDIIVCTKREYAQNGQIVVAIIDEDWATLKRYYHKEGTITLKPSNISMQDQVYDARRVQIQGIYVGLLRLCDSYGYGT